MMNEQDKTAHEGEPFCAQCGKRTRGNYVECVKCGKVLCDCCDVRGEGKFEEPHCRNCGGQG